MSFYHMIISTKCDKTKVQGIKYISNWGVPKQPYLPKEYGDGFIDFQLNYIETRICFF
jgi:hypothetical protein